MGLAKAGISFAAAPGCNAIAVVEYVLSALLWLAQRDGLALRDKIVGIVGAVNVGGRLQQQLNAFGVQTCAIHRWQKEHLGTGSRWEN